jgi:hypothetical protein
MADWDDTPGEESLTIPGSTGKPLASVRHDDGLVVLDVTTKPPGAPATIAPANARDLAAGLIYIARCAELAGAKPQAPGPGELTIADEVKVSAWMDAAALIRHVWEQQTDLEGFHRIEGGPDKAWMTQALAVIAEDLLGELTEAQAKLSQFGKKSTAQEILAERLHIIRTIQMRRADQRAEGR